MMDQVQYNTDIIIEKRDNKMLSKFINKGYEAQFCQLCHTYFNLLKLQRIHKCKRCQKYVCFKCGSQKQKILDEDDKWTEQAHRVCLQCWTQLNRIYDMITDNNLQWNKVSKFAIQWVDKMDDGIKKDYQYQHFLKLFYSNLHNFEEENQIIDKDVVKGRTDYSVFNYSLKEFFYIIQQKQSTALTRKNMANVLYAVAARYDQIGYVQGMSGISAYLLCFGDEKTAFTMFCDIIEHIYPPKFFVKGNYGVNLMGMMAEIHFLKQYYLHWIKNVKGPLISHDRDPYNEQQLQQIGMIVELSASKALLSLFTGFLAYSHIDFIWRQMKNKRTFEVVQRGFLAALYIRRQQLLQRKSFKNLEKLFETINLEQYIQAYHDFDIDQSMRKRLIQQYYDSVSKKWSSNLDYNIKTLYKYTNFTQQQMKIIQKYSIGDQKNGASLFLIKKEEFIELVKCFYQILKESLDEDEPILEITPFFVSKIYDTYNQNKKNGLDFRQFICCLSACTKSKLKQRLCAIINTYQDKNNHISYYSFEKLIKSLCQLSPQSLNANKQLFLQRMDRNFKKQKHISISQLHIILNDDYINQLAAYVKIQVPGIIENMMKMYDNKIRMRININKNKNKQQQFQELKQ